MRNIVYFGASNSQNSINDQLAQHAANYLKGVTINQLNLNDFEMPLYSIDRENTEGIPDLAQKFSEVIKGADGVIVSFAEHNGSYTVAFKNIFDWVSRFDNKTWSGTPMLMLSTSPGARGGASVLNTATQSFPHFGAKVLSYFSLPEFGKNFDKEKGITDEKLQDGFFDAVQKFATGLGMPVSA